MLVVVVDNLLSVIHATVTDLDSVAVEDLSELVILREVFIYQGEESVTDIRVDIFTEWRIVPEDVVTLSVFPFSSRCWFVMQSVVVSAFVECFLVRRGGLVE